MAEDKSTSKIVVIVIVLVVIAIILLLIFRSNTFDYFRNMPGYQIDKTDKVVDNLPEGQLGKIVCQGKPGKIIASVSKTEQTRKVSRFEWANDQPFIFIDGVNTNLYIYADKTFVNSLKFWKNTAASDFNTIKYAVGNDVVMGRISNNQIFSVPGVGTSTEIGQYMGRLDGAYFYTTNQICIQEAN